MADDEARDVALTRREEEVARAYALGASYKEIARDLGVSPTTVRSHLRTVYGKLGVTSKIELARSLDDDAARGPRDASDMAAELALELDEAARRERSLARVLRIISEQDDSPDHVIDAVLDHALEICEAEFGILFEHLGGTRFRELRSRNIPRPFADWLAEQGVFEVGPETGIGRVATGLQAINLPDVRADDAYREGAPLRIATAELGRARSFAAIPMLSRGRLIGVFSVYRTRIHPFGDRTLELAQVFADQAAIAIETANRFRELEIRLARERTNREILEIIRRTRDDERPVFEAIVRSAVALCGVRFCMFWRYDGAQVHYCASAGFSAEFMADYTADYPMPPRPGGLVAETIRTGRTVRLPHAQDAAVYYDAEVAAQHDYDHMIGVPVETEDGLWGVLVLAWPTGAVPQDGQVEQLETFATQAVIAIENAARARELARLNAELGDRVEAQGGEIARMARLKRFLSPAVAEALARSGGEDLPASHRSLIATLFCDIRGFTAFCERAEPEETIEVLQTYHREMGRLISAHRAGVDKRMGDGIMVVFNDPFPTEDPAGAAVRLALAMRERMTELCGGWKRLGHRLGFGVGVSLGYATIGVVGSEGRYDYTASGTAVNLAARLCDRAEDGEILLSPRAATAVEDAFAVESSGELTLKGIREPVEVFRLVGA
ncbi:GAF domain-containing protein [Albimonas sp. CAU 1670]|uniref:GAF domain-containing protein n=1 Tax=Albimonas sp. CAU 1670 TaxID=3032599 RepID=UPI0023DB01C7|nr:GAF domain-containing protein [Albimonas sp. CAU 1670]MDF2232393.1 GAF domain-containing protein [Albimonas sp. CAU 1670]